MKKSKDKQILIAGATGLIGQELTRLLVTEGYTVMILTRNPKMVHAEFREKIGYIEWQGIFTTWLVREVEKSFAVINLAGEGIANKRWTRKRRVQIVSSRLVTTNALAKACMFAKKKPEVFIQASAIGYYPNSLTGVYDEESPHGNTFLSILTKDWEAVAMHDVPPEIRLVIIRTGIVLSSKGGMFPQLTFPIKLFVGSWFGKGIQIMSWIHVHDEVRAILHLLENPETHGVYNLAAPYPVTQKEIVSQIAKKIKRPAWFSIPTFIIILIFGKVGRDLLLASQNINSKKLQKSKFTFSYPTIDKALEDLFKD
jgi:hypothetical protein